MQAMLDKVDKIHDIVVDVQDKVTTVEGKCAFTRA